MDEHYVKWCVVLFFPPSPPDDDRRRRRRYHSGWLLVGNIARKMVSFQEDAEGKKGIKIGRFFLFFVCVRMGSG